MSVRVEHGDMREVLGRMVAEGVTVQSIVTDPPYGIGFMGKEWDSPDGFWQRKANRANKWDRPNGNHNPSNSADAARTRLVQGRRYGEWCEQWARLCWDVLPPGGHMVCFGSTRTFHRMATAIEEAGFEIRDTIAYMYGSGFPKSHNVSKKIERCGCEPDRPQPERDLRAVFGADVPAAVPTDGRQGTLLQPGMSQQGASSALLQRPAAAEGISEPSVEGRRDLSQAPRQLRERALRPLPAGAVEHGEDRRLRDGASAGNGALGGPGAGARGDGASHRSRTAEQSADQSGTVAGQPESQAGGAWPVCGGCGKPIVPDGLGTALKPAMELICLARKPLVGTVAANVLQHGTGALNIDGCRIATDWKSERGEAWLKSGKGTAFANSAQQGPPLPAGSTVADRVNDKGRWPANVVTDGSDEVVSAFPETNGSGSVRGTEPSECHSGVYSGPHGRMPFEAHAGTGSAARFFYSSKADADDRLGSKHPTVKPVDLMRWLVRLVTPKGGTVLDPFAGSGTTGMACMAEGFDCIMVEAEAEYVADIRRRIAHVSGDDTPLFSTPTEAA